MPNCGTGQFIAVERQTPVGALAARDTFEPRELTAKHLQRRCGEIDPVQRKGIGAAGSRCRGATHWIDGEPVIDVHRCDIPADPDAGLFGLDRVGGSLAQQHQHAVDTRSWRSELAMHQQPARASVGDRDPVFALAGLAPLDAQRNRLAGRLSDWRGQVDRRAVQRGLHGPRDLLIVRIDRHLPVRRAADAIEQWRIVLLADELQVRGTGARDPYASLFARNLKGQRPSECFGGQIGGTRVAFGELQLAVHGGQHR